MTPLGQALRRKFRSPRDLLRALGLPPALLDIKRLAFDSALATGTSAKQQLDDLLCQVLSGHQLQAARDLLHSIDDDDGEKSTGEIEQQEAEDDEDVDEESEEQARREERKKAMTKVADFLSTHKGMSEGELAETLADFPSNGLSHLGGRLAEDLEQLMKDRARRGAKDQKRNRQAFDRRYPTAVDRVTAGSVESDYGSPMPARCVVSDSAAAVKSFNERFPGAARIG